MKVVIPEKACGFEIGWCWHATDDWCRGGQRLRKSNSMIIVPDSSYIL